MLAEQIRKSFPKKIRHRIEIRAVAGSAGRTIASRLQKSLELGGLDASIVEVANAPHEEILIESSQQAAGAALALQSAFRAAGIQAQLLVHERTDPNLVVLYLGLNGSEAA